MVLDVCYVTVHNVKVNVYSVLISNYDVVDYDMIFKASYKHLLIENGGVDATGLVKSVLFMSGKKVLYAINNLSVVRMYFESFKNDILPLEE